MLETLLSGSTEIWVPLYTRIALSAVKNWRQYRKWCELVGMVLRRTCKKNKIAATVNARKRNRSVPCLCYDGVKDLPDFCFDVLCARDDTQSLQPESLLSWYPLRFESSAVPFDRSVVE